MSASLRAYASKGAVSADDGERLALCLARFLERPLTLSLTDNRSTIVYVRRGPDGLEARVHHMFALAPQSIVRALARYLESADRQASRTLGRYIDRNQRMIRGPARERPPVARTLRTRGRVYDLADIFDELNEKYFGGRLEARITWGPRRGMAGRRRSIKLGSYSVEDGLVRVHPLLDQPFVPPYFIASVVYHEMLHQLHDIPRRNGRRVFHTPAFLADERRFSEFERARRWEKENVDRLLAA